MTKDIQLFDYQEDMVKRVLETFRYHDSVMVQMPTGTGKTMVLANIVFSFLEKSNNPIWIVAHRRELVSQIKETIFSKITPSLFTLEGTEKVPIFKDQNGKCLRFITSPSTNRLSKAMLDRKRRVKLRFLRH